MDNQEGPDREDLLEKQAVKVNKVLGVREVSPVDQDHLVYQVREVFPENQEHPELMDCLDSEVSLDPGVNLDQLEKVGRQVQQV